jgi:hypothetical protein
MVVPALASQFSTVHTIIIVIAVVIFYDIRPLGTAGSFSSELDVNAVSVISDQVSGSYFGPELLTVPL